MTKNKNRKPGKKSGMKKQFKEPSPQSQVYSGPLSLPGQKEGNAVRTEILVFTGALASTAGGIIDSFYSDDPNSYGLSEWTSLIALWKEYRILGYKVAYFPNNRYSKSTTVCAPVIVVADRDSAAALGSYQTAASHASSEIRSLEDPWTRSMKSIGSEEMQFRSTSSTLATKWIKFYSDGLSVSTSYGRFVVSLMIQFRNRA